MEKTVIEIIESDIYPKRLEVKVSRDIFDKEVRFKFIRIEEKGDLKRLKPGEGKDLMKYILRNSIFGPWLSGISVISAKAFIVSLHEMSQEAKERLIEAFGIVFEQEKIARSIKERIVFS